jgi:hypothetical protein
LIQTFISVALIFGYWMFPGVRPSVTTVLVKVIIDCVIASLIFDSAMRRAIARQPMLSGKWIKFKEDLIRKKKTRGSCGFFYIFWDLKFLLLSFWALGGLS